MTDWNTLKGMSGMSWLEESMGDLGKKGVTSNFGGRTNDINMDMGVDTSPHAFGNSFSSTYDPAVGDRVHWGPYDSQQQGAVNGPPLIAPPTYIPHTPGAVTHTGPGILVRQGVDALGGTLSAADDAIEALKKSVKLDNPSDWQLLVELTSAEKAGES